MAKNYRLSRQALVLEVAVHKDDQQAAEASGKLAMSRFERPLWCVEELG